MRIAAYHGSPGEAFDHFDPVRTGTTSGYEHAEGVASFTSSLEVAREYAAQDGFIGQFEFRLEQPFVIDDQERDCGIRAFLSRARDAGHDGVVLMNCCHTAISPGEPSTITYLFAPETARRVETIQSGPAAPAAAPRRGR